MSNASIFHSELRIWQGVQSIRMVEFPQLLYAKDTPWVNNCLPSTSLRVLYNFLMRCIKHWNTMNIIIMFNRCTRYIVTAYCYSNNIIKYDDKINCLITFLVLKVLDQITVLTTRLTSIFWDFVTNRWLIFFLIYILKFGLSKLGIYEENYDKNGVKLTKCGNHTQ